MRIGHYEIHDELARGGTGVVYRAVDARSGARVVVKLLKVESDTSRRRLAREAAAMRRLQHPSVVTLYDAGSHHGHAFLVLPYVEGQTLQDRLEREGPLPPGEAVRIAIQVGEGLRASHALGLLHRDVKPANVLVDAALGDRVKLTDFGLVKDTGPGQSQTQSLSVHGRFLGTPGYWPPEQAFGVLDAIGPPADVYGLGALLYALLCGAAPRQAETLVGALVAFKRPVEPLPSGVPRWLDALLGRCFADDPAARPPLEAVLEELEAGGVEQPEGRAAEPRSDLHVRRATWLLVVCGLVGGAVFALWPEAAPPDSQAPGVELDAPAEPDAPGNPGGEGPDAAAYFERGLSKSDAELHEEAIADFDRSLELRPDDPSVLFARGRSKGLLDRHEEAIADFDRSLELAANPAAFSSRGAAKSLAGRHEEALADFDRALELDPTNVGILLNRGESHTLLGNYEEGLADFDRVRRLGADLEGRWFTRGKCLLLLGRYQEAIADYDRALELEPDEVEGYHCRGQALSLLGFEEEAIADFDRALRLDPSLALGYSDRGTAKGNLGRLEEAVADFDRSLELDPTRAESYYGRGSFKIRLGRLEAAIADLDRALELAPDNAQYYLNRGVAYANLGRHEEALADYERVVQANPDQHSAYLNRGIARASLGRHEEAIADYDRVLQHEPSMIQTFAHRGISSMQLGRYAEAIADFDRALSAGTLTPGAATVVRKHRAQAVAKQASGD